MSRDRFDNRIAQIVGASYWALITLIGITLITDPASRWAGLVFIVLGLFLAWRSLRSSTVVVDDTGVVTRSVVRTRRYAYSDLRNVEVAVGRTGWNGFGREYLVFHRFDGHDVAFRGLNCRPSGDPAGVSVVRCAAGSANRRLHGS
jgi:hypothetical protein